MLPKQVVPQAGRNSVKAYDKAGSILRVETTTNDPYALRAIRPKASTSELATQPVRKTVADLERSTATRQLAHERNLNALAELDQDRIYNFRKTHRIPQPKARRSEDALTMNQAVEHLGISHNGLLGHAGELRRRC